MVHLVGHAAVDGTVALWSKMDVDAHRERER